MNTRMNPNVEQIRSQATRVVKGKIPREVRAALMEAVKAGELGRLPKKGLAPEIFFHPDHKNGAIERQKREVEYSVSCIAKVVVPASELSEDDQLAMIRGLSQQ